MISQSGGKSKGDKCKRRKNKVFSNTYIGDNEKSARGISCGRISFDYALI
jgi:hypothetical protein